MNNSELLNYIFDGVEEEFILISEGRDDRRSVAEAHTPIATDVILIDLFLPDSKSVVGVPVGDASLGTIRLSKDGRDDVYVALFDVPVEEADLPESVDDLTIPIQNGWSAHVGTDKFYLLEEVFPLTGKEDEDAPSSESEVMEAEDLGDELGESTSSEDNGDASDVGGDEFSDPSPEAEDPNSPSNSGDLGTVSDKTDQEIGSAGEEPQTPTSDDQSDGAVTELERQNDAVLHGVETDAWHTLMDQPATLLMGNLWGARDRRNTQDGDWKEATLTWGAWIDGGPRERGMLPWGFSRHPIGKHKEGQCLVMGSSIGGARKAKAMDEMFAIGLDVDSGAQLDGVLDKLEDLGVACLVYTSYNHGKSGLALKRDDVLRKLQIDNDPSDQEVRNYLTLHGKDRFEADFISRCTIKDQKYQTTDGLKILVDTPPLDKFRLIFPLAEPVKLMELGNTDADSLAIWEDAVTGLAQNTIGIYFDAACTDPSRLFYTARHAQDAEDWYCAIVRGDPLVFEDIEPMRKSAYTAKRETNVFIEASGDDGEDDLPPLCLTPSGKSLNDWHKSAKDRFLIADLLEDHCPDKIRKAGGEAQGHVHTECPFEHEHSGEGGTGTMAINALDSSSEYWTWFCHHDACQGRHKLQFLEEALRAGWFEEELLFDEDGGYLLEPLEVEEEEKPALEADLNLSPSQQAENINDDSSQKDIEDLIESLVNQGVDRVERAAAIETMSKNTRLGKRELSSMWKQIEAVHKANAQEAKKVKATVAVVNQWDFSQIHEYGSKRIHDTNRKTPSVFHYMENLTIIRENSEGKPIMRFLDRGGFAHHLNTVAKFARVSGEDERKIGVSAPVDVVNYLFEEDYGKYPDLQGLVTTPIFTKSGTILSEPGYDWGSKLFYNPDNSLTLRKVDAIPSPEDVFEAKRLLIEEVLADFPLGALTRTEIIEQGLHGEGVPAVTNMIAMILLPFMREMISGPTPGHLLVKPTPGTGASLLTDLFSIISDGVETPALAMPHSNEEMGKTLAAVLSNGQNIVFFDNINHSVDSAELAMAMTQPTYQARLLGRTQTVDAKVRCVWVFTGNNVTLSPELVRRLIMIDLDARLENPEKRTGFKYENIKDWVREHRSELVWACLTLIQNWVAQGSPHQKDVVMASYESWSGAVGGVLKSVGLGGFLGNREELKAAATDTTGDDVSILMEAWWDNFGQSEVPVKGTDKAPGLIELANTEDLSLPMKKEVNMDGERTYSSRSFGTFLGKHKGKIKTMEDGSIVRIVKADTRTKQGFKWFLEKLDDEDAA